jgi:hypothetical protein
VREIIRESLKLAAWGAAAVSVNAGMLGLWAVARLCNRALGRRR